MIDPGPADALSRRSLAKSGALWALAAFALAVALGRAGAFGVFDRALYDGVTARSATEPQDPRVRAVYVGDTYVERMKDTLGRWPWRTRAPHAAALTVLRQAGASVAAFDLHFTEPVLDQEGSDQSLAEEMAVFGPVVLGCLFDTAGTQRWTEPPSAAGRAALDRSGGTFGASIKDNSVEEGTGVLLPIDPFLQATPLVGHTNPAVDSDGAIRRMPLFVRQGARFYPSLGLRAAMEFLGVGPDGLTADFENREVRLVPKSGATIRIPVDPDGCAWMHFDRPIDEFEAFGYQDLPDAPKDRLKGALVVLGASITGVQDRWSTPRSPAMPGFLVHAQFAENVLTGRFITAVRPMDGPLGGRETLLLAVLLVVACATAAVSACVGRAARWLIGFAVAAGPIALAAWLLTAHRVWVPPTAATVALFAAGSLGAAHRETAEARRRRGLRRIYERYVSPRVLDAVVRNPESLSIRGVRKELTVFFSDIRGFTALAESMEAEDLVDRLNEYFRAMTEIVHAHEGTIDKFIGDAIMVFFNDPVAQPDHAERAVGMALAMKTKMEELRASWRERGLREFRIGIGIASGYATVGNFGSERFADYTAIGNTVNLAARIEHESIDDQVLVGARTYHAVKHAFECRPLGARVLKGFEEPQELWEVVEALSRRGVAEHSG